LKILEDLQGAKFQEMLWAEGQNARDTTEKGTIKFHRNTPREEEIIRKRTFLIKRLQRQIDELTKERDAVVSSTANSLPTDQFLTSGK
jgi:hypothetical protein